MVCVQPLLPPSQCGRDQSILYEDSTTLRFFQVSSVEKCETNLISRHKNQENLGQEKVHSVRNRVHRRVFLSVLILRTRQCTVVLPLAASWYCTCLHAQVWDRANTSDTLLGSARVMISESLSQDSDDGWYRLVGSGDQVGLTLRRWRQYCRSCIALVFSTYLWK